jgi:hypothetical protein
VLQSELRHLRVSRRELRSQPVRQRD